MRWSAGLGPHLADPEHSTPRWSTLTSAGRSDPAPWRGPAIPAAVNGKVTKMFDHNNDNSIFDLFYFMGSQPEFIVNV